MIEEDRDCVDILLQVAAARGALDGLGKLLLRSHMEASLADAVASARSKERRQKVGDLMAVLSKVAQIGGR